MKYLQIAREVSVIVLVWATLLFGWMQFDANRQCMDYQSPHATITFKHGVVCSLLLDGSEYVMPISVLKEKAGK